LELELGDVYAQIDDVEVAFVVEGDNESFLLGEGAELDAVRDVRGSA